MSNFSELFNQIDKSENKQTNNDLIILHFNELIENKSDMFKSVAENMGTYEELPHEVREKLNILDTLRLKEDIDSKELSNQLNDSSVIMDYVTLSNRLSVLITITVNYNGEFNPNNILIKDMVNDSIIYQGTFKGLSDYTILENELIEYNTDLIKLIELRGTIVDVEALENLVNYSTSLIEYISLNEQILLFLQNISEMKQYKRRLLNRYTAEYNSKLGIAIKYDNAFDNYKLYRDMFPKQYFIFTEFPDRTELREVERYFNLRNNTVFDIDTEIEILEMLDMYDDNESDVSNLLTHYKKSFGKLMLRKNKFKIYINSDSYSVTFIKDNKMYRETINSTDDLKALIMALIERKLI